MSFTDRKVPLYLQYKLADTWQLAEVSGLYNVNIGMTIT